MTKTIFKQVRRVAWSAVPAITALLASGSAVAGAFTPGNLIVLQAGDGAQTLSAYGNELFVDQFTTAGALVSSNAIPTNGVSAFLQVGTQGTEGQLSLTPNGRQLVLAGYGASYGYSNTLNVTIVNSTSAQIPRAIGTVDAFGNFDLAATSASDFSTYYIRGAASDGNFNFWAVGSGGTPANTEGVAYFGANTASVLGSTVYNDRAIQDVGGNLYYATGSGNRGIVEITGTPTSQGTTATNYVIYTGQQFPGSSGPSNSGSSPYAFAFNPSMTVCYVGDGNNFTNATTPGGIEKWTNGPSGWAFAYSFSPAAVAGNGPYEIAVSFGATTNIYGTFYNGTNIFAVTDNGPGSVGAIIASTHNPNIVLRGISFAPTNAPAGTAPVIAAITPATVSANVGSSAGFNLLFTSGDQSPTATWYKIANSATNIVAGATGTFLNLTNLQTTNSGGYFAVLANDSGSVTSSVAQLTVVAKPSISAISPASITTNAGQNVTFTLTYTTGTPPGSNFWYQVTTSPLHTNLVAGATSPSLTLTNVVAANAGSYYAVISNASGSATSTLAQLTVVDPIIEVEPNSAQGLVNGQVQFGITAAGTAPLSYQWHLSDAGGDVLAAVANGVQADNSVVFGANSSVLTITNLQTNTVLNNYVVVVTNTYGAVTSTVASLVSVVANGGMLALFDFDGPQFTNTAVYNNSIAAPAPFIGYATAFSVGTPNDPGTSPFSGATDPNDVAGVFTPYGFPQLSPNFSWGTENYPAVTGTNKANGVQFNVSTVGAKNITVTYDSRVSATASEYERLQYTTNGSTWIDYPSSSSFDTLYGSGNAGYYTFGYSLVGFPGVNNNPNFGVRVVTEWQSTATYQSAATMANTNNLGVNGVTATNFWVGADNSYASGASGNSAAGTVTYDIVAIQGDAITNNNVPPSLGSIASTNMVDTNSLTLNFVAVGGTTAPDQLTYSAAVVPEVAANPSEELVTLYPSFAFGGSGTNRTLTISFGGSPIPDALDADPILVTATDAAGDSAATWFLLTVGSINQPPTNTLTAVQTTNVLANGSVTIPFLVGSARDASTNFSFTIASDNNTVIPQGNVVISGNTNTGMLFLTITPALNEVGNAKISVSVTDNDPAEPRTTTANIETMVRPNTNVILVDYFNYDSSGPLDVVASAFWDHLSGHNQELQEDAGFAQVDAAAGHTENVQATLLNSPYSKTGSAVLYASFLVNLQTLPSGAGSYFTVFNDGSGNTADVECRLVATTNDVVDAGDYRLGIANFTSGTGTNSQVFPEDLTPGVDYLVMVSLTVSNGFSTLWVSPTNQISPSVTDTTPASNATNVYNISDFELRESGATSGNINVGNLTVATAFNSAYYPCLANPEAFSVAANTTSVLNVLAGDAGSGLGLVSVTPDTNATATISGANINFVPATNFVGVSTVGYTIVDDLGNTSSSTISVTVTNAAPATPIPIAVQYYGAGSAGAGAGAALGSLVLSWSNPAFSLQTTTNLASTNWTTIVGATSPYTNLVGTNATQFYRLAH